MAVIRFHFDEHVPEPLANELRKRGIDVTLTADAGLSHAPDEAHVAFAVESDRVVVTNDRDFLRMHSRGTPHRGIAYYADQRRNIKSLADELEALVGVYAPEQMHNRVEYL